MFHPPTKKEKIIKETEKKTRTPVLKSLKNNTGVVRIVDRWIDFTTQKLFIHLK